MQVSEILKVKGNTLFTIAPEGKLSEAVSLMAQHNMGSLVVIDRGHVVGILTFKEVLAAVDRGRGALGEASVGEIMERDPVTATSVLPRRAIDSFGTRPNSASVLASIYGPPSFGIANGIALLIDAAIASRSGAARATSASTSDGIFPPSSTL